jgi:hypothetical protein
MVDEDCKLKVKLKLELELKWSDDVHGFIEGWKAKKPSHSPSPA